MSPKVGVLMDDRTLRDFEDFLHGDGQKGEVSELGIFLEVIVGAPAYQSRAPLEAGEALESGGTVTFGVTPFPVPVEMIVSDHSLPKGGDFIVRQADIATGNRSPGKSADKKVVRVSPILLANAGEVGLAIIYGGLTVAPPGHCVLTFSFLNIGHGDPNESFAAA